MSAKTGAGLDELREALGAGRRPCVEATQCRSAAADRPALRRPRLHPARDRHRRRPGRSGRVGRRGRRAARRAGRPRGAGAQRAGARRARRARRGRAAGRARAARGSSAGELRRGDALVAPGALSGRAIGSTSRSRSWSRSPDGARLLVHHGTAAVPAASSGRASGSRSSGSPRRSSPPAATASCSARARPSAAARPRPGARRGTRTRRGSSVSERGEATIHAPVLRDGRLALLAEPGSQELAAELGPRASTPPIRSTPASPAPTEPWAKDVLRRSPFERRGSRLYRPGAAAGSAPREPRRGRGGGGSSPRRSRVRRRSTTPSSRASSSGRAGSSGSETATPSPPRPSSGLARCCSTSARPRGRISLARFRDLVGCGRRDAQLLLERLDADGRDPPRRATSASSVAR